MSFVKEVKGEVFEPNRFGFICALSRSESSSDLRQDDNYVSSTANNRVAKKIINSLGYMGYFQFGKIALQTIGYKNQEGNWTGLDGADSQASFLNSREIQLKAVNRLINENCKLLRNNNVNEYYGKVINGIELTESGAIAGCHLVGLGGLAAYLDLPNNLKFKRKKKNGKWVITSEKHPQSDGNNVHISEYIKKFNNYDLESCCKRKLLISFKKSGQPLINEEVTIKSIFNNGKLFNQEVVVKHKTDENGRIPVIVRHPNTKINFIVLGVDSEIIEQLADHVQIKTINTQGNLIVNNSLEEANKPQPRPQQTKTPQEVRNEQNTAQAKNDTASQMNKDVNFNIQIVEEDSGKAISNMGFYLTYKGNIKKHIADSAGIKKGIVAELGEDIEVCVSGEGKYQKIYHFKVVETLNNNTLKVKLPVHSFKINIKHNNQYVPNILVSIFYRNREIIKRTDVNGNINVKMLTGFVYGFGIKNKEVEKVRVLKDLPIRHFIVNEGFVKASKLYEVADQKRKEADALKDKADEMKRKQQQEEQEKKAKEQAKNAKSEAERNQPLQNDTHTENGGKPLTTVGNQAPATSDTTRFHIYHDGKIKRENKAATGYAEYIYYDKNGGIHNIGKTEFIVAPKRKNGNGLVGGSVYLVDQRKLKSYKSVNGRVGYIWDIYLPGRTRYYLKGDAFAAVIGAMCSLGYGYYHGSGFSVRDGSSVGSTSHYNGINGDFRYLGINGCHKDGPVLVSQEARFDWDANVRFVNALYKFGYKAFGSQVMKRKGQPNRTLPHVTFTNSDHDNHLHLQGYQPNIEDI